MITSRERMIRAFRHEPPVDRVPRDLWKLYGILMMRKDEFDAIHERFDFDVAKQDITPEALARNAARGYCEVGTYKDDWGCVYTVAERGVSGEVSDPRIKDWDDLKHFRPPYEIIERTDIDAVNRACAATDKFVWSGSGVNPFERLQYLRGPQNVYMDLAYGEPGLFQLLDMIHDYNCKAIRKWAKTDVDCVNFMDDWGSQNSLLISPEMWRQVFKPLYKDYCDIIRESGKFILFHSDGFTETIYPDLIEIGVHAVNTQLFCMDIEKLAEKYRGKIVFYGEVDRQHLLPFGTEEEVRAGVRRLHKALKPELGGVVAQCCWGLKDPYENIVAVYDEWEKCL